MMASLVSSSICPRSVDSNTKIPVERSNKFCVFCVTDSKSFHRWYRHISSYSSEMKSLPGVIKSLQQLGFGDNDVGGKAEDKKKGDDEDDDFDLFGSDDEVDEEAERIKQERLKVSDAFVCRANLGAVS